MYKRGVLHQKNYLTSTTTTPTPTPAQTAASILRPELLDLFRHCSCQYSGQYLQTLGHANNVRSEWENAE